MRAQETRSREKRSDHQDRETLLGQSELLIVIERHILWKRVPDGVREFHATLSAGEKKSAAPWGDGALDCGDPEGPQSGIVIREGTPSRLSGFVTIERTWA